MKQSLLVAALLALAVSACSKQEEPAPVAAPVQETAPADAQATEQAQEGAEQAQEGAEKAAEGAQEAAEGAQEAAQAAQEAAKEGEQK